MSVTPSEVLHVGDSEREDGAMCQAVGTTWLPCGAEGIPLPALSALLRDAQS
jgi:FMN phosphatase YigB (HAD superfamily)